MNSDKYIIGGEGMYPNYPYSYNQYPGYYIPQPYHDYYRSYYGNAYNPYYAYNDYRQPVSGKATWTEGGAVTKCNIPWSRDDYMTVAVGEGAPYQCGQKITVKNMSSGDQQEIEVTVVDQVVGYPPNKINLHRKAFEALGAKLDAGVIDVEISVYSQMESSKWGNYLMTVTQSAYPDYQISDYKAVGKTEVSSERTKVTYEFVLQAPQGMLKVRSSVVYNPKTGRMVSFDIKEM